MVQQQMSQQQQQRLRQQVRTLLKELRQGQTLLKELRQGQKKQRQNMAMERQGQKKQRQNMAMEDNKQRQQQRQQQRQRQKQKLIIDLTNPFYIHNGEGHNLVLNEKDLKIIFQKQDSMVELLQDTPKYQLRKLFRTRRQDQQIKDVLEKASVSTIKKLEEGVILFDMFFLKDFIQQLERKSIDKLKTVEYMRFRYSGRGRKKYRKLRENQNKLRIWIHESHEGNIRRLNTDLDNLLADLFSIENGTLNEEHYEHYDSFIKMFYKIQLYYKKIYRPAFLNECLEHEGLLEYVYDFRFIDIYKKSVEPIINIFDTPMFETYLENILRNDFSSVNYNALFDQILQELPSREQREQRQRQRQQMHNRIRQLIRQNQLRQQQQLRLRQQGRRQLIRRLANFSQVALKDVKKLIPNLDMYWV